MTITTDITFREISEDEWEIFTGAQSWNDEEPLISEGHLNDHTPYFMLLDRNGGCILLYDSQDQQGCLQLNLEFAHQAEARAFIYDNIQRLTLECFINAGFMEV